MLVTTTERLYDFNKFGKPSISFDDIRKGKVKIAEASDLQRKFKHELSDEKRLQKKKKYFYNS